MTGSRPALIRSPEGIAADLVERVGPRRAIAIALEILDAHDPGRV